MKKILAIAWLTWKAAFRFKLVAVLLTMMIFTVVVLPVIIKDDGTARGFVQILLTYTLTVIAGLLGLCTLWIACGTLARDIEECQIQLVATKPISRWQIWIGKWVGIILLNTAILTITGILLLGLFYWRASKLDSKQQHILFNEVLVARQEVKPQYPIKELEQQAQQLLKERLGLLQYTNLDKIDIQAVRREILEQLKADYQLVPPMTLSSPGYRRWDLNLGINPAKIKGKPLYIRTKFYAGNAAFSGTVTAMWQAGVPGTAKIWRSEPMSLAPDTFHEIEIPPDLFDKNGDITVVFINLSDVPLIFPMEDGIELLYPAGSFVWNFARGLGIILCWMALLAALGLATASYLSFPVAAFVAMAALVLAFSTGIMTTAISEGILSKYDEQTHQFIPSILDIIFIPLFKAILAVVSPVKQFSPIDKLTTGRLITWAELAQAILIVVALVGGLLAVVGNYLFYKRELAAGEATK